MRREHHGFAIAGLAIAACALVGGVVVALTTLVPGPGEPGWTGAAVEVPYCPADADGCRLGQGRSRRTATRTAARHRVP